MRRLRGRARVQHAVVGALHSLHPTAFCTRSRNRTRSAGGSGPTETHVMAGSLLDGVSMTRHRTGKPTALARVLVASALEQPLAPMPSMPPPSCTHAASLSAGTDSHCASAVLSATSSAMSATPPVHATANRSRASDGLTSHSTSVGGQGAEAGVVTASDQRDHSPQPMWFAWRTRASYDSHGRSSATNVHGAPRPSTGSVGPSVSRAPAARCAICTAVLAAPPSSSGHCQETARPRSTPSHHTARGSEGGLHPVVRSCDNASLSPLALRADSMNEYAQPAASPPTVTRTRTPSRSGTASNSAHVSAIEHGSQPPSPPLGSGRCSRQYASIGASPSESGAVHSSTAVDDVTSAAQRAEHGCGRVGAAVKGPSTSDQTLRPTSVSAAKRASSGTAVGSPASVHCMPLAHGSTSTARGSESSKPLPHPIWHKKRGAARAPPVPPSARQTVAAVLETTVKDSGRGGSGSVHGVVTAADGGLSFPLRKQRQRRVSHRRRFGWLAFVVPSESGLHSHACHDWHPLGKTAELELPSAALAAVNIRHAHSESLRMRQLRGEAGVCSEPAV